MWIIVTERLPQAMLNLATLFGNLSLAGPAGNDAIRWGWCEHNPTKGVRRNKEKPRDRYITDEEFELIRSHADSQWQCIMDIAYLTAMRRGDIMRLRLSDITGDSLLISQGKTGKKMAFVMIPALEEVISRSRSLRRRVGSLYFFCTRDGQPYSVVSAVGIVPGDVF
ncbi:tyrosine-type recombinase/integrase [Acidithiobacillus ferriphilus]|uniref:tyrosine-type recombinase/integrase n=1 Tax=Acidithiobacillus ferriphilus TaxID=1689834 RepID=UPI002DB9CC2C|nr:tyrosine-type recombinase/integrase [Acidithiobacillus ferriphilus]MEB8536433.1 tyrosine-type recombinase/integrase [Acidithiobacillus ferriphilus]